MKNSDTSYCLHRLYDNGSWDRPRLVERPQASRCFIARSPTGEALQHTCPERIRREAGKLVTGPRRRLARGPSRLPKGQLGHSKPPRSKGFARAEKTRVEYRTEPGRDAEMTGPNRIWKASLSITRSRKAGGSRKRTRI